MLLRQVFCPIINSEAANAFWQFSAKQFCRICAKHANNCYSTETDVSKIPIERIRNFSIIAHIDHGKSTLADRILEITGAIEKNTGKQVLDTLQVEKQRGITVKAQTASLNYMYKGSHYLLNLIDTPGHVDFSAEVHRALAACQGVILVVDANDGVQAQTMANYYLAKEQNLVVIPVINKIDLKHARPEKVVKQLHTLFDINEEDILKISAKEGIGIMDVLDRTIEKIPPPDGCRNKAMKALIFDSWFDKFKGANSLIYIKDGSLKLDQHITLMHTKKSYQVKSLAILRPIPEQVTELFAGQIGCMTCGMKSSSEASVGDTIHLKKDTLDKPLIGFKVSKPMVFSGVYPLDHTDFDNLQSAIEKLMLNDSSVSVSFESSIALGRGWRIGFLGLLHMEVFIQRLQQEYNAEPIVTMPSVVYKAKIFGAKHIKKYGADTITFNNPLHMPDLQIVSEFYEPVVLGTIIVSNEYLQSVMDLCDEYRGKEKQCTDIGNDRFMYQSLLPLNEILTDFHDELKRVSSGYASFDYEEYGYEPSNIVKLDVLLNGMLVDEFSHIVHKSKANTTARTLCKKLENSIPRQLFQIAIQVVTGAKVLARENLKAYRKDVTAKLYGGDVTRRKKLLAQQAEGKKKMRMCGKIALSQETFIKILKK